MHTVTLANRDNASYEVSGRKALLDELRDQGVDLPYGCRYGGCITCAARLLGGEVDQRGQVALNNRQLSQGYVILCVARALGDCTLEVGVDSHGSLYRNPFLDPLAPHELKADIAAAPPSTGGQAASMDRKDQAGRQGREQGGGPGKGTGKRRA